MKKPKTKPVYWWVAENPSGKKMPHSTSFWRSFCWASLCKLYDDDQRSLRKEGWRVVKVEVREKKCK